jgi:hypothetical protein
MNDERNRLSTRDLADAARRERAEERREPIEDRRDRVEARDVAAAVKPSDRSVARPAVDAPPAGPHAAGTPPQPAPGAAAPGSDLQERDSLFHDHEASGFRTRWEAIQTGFVDEPRKAVEEADALVAQAVARLAEVFSDERAALERQWDRGDNVSTEDLRITLRRYRAFFDRLLAV